MRTNSIAGALTLFLLSVAVHGANGGERGGANHVVLVVWDGMRPDLVSRQNAPTLWNLAKNGVTFRDHHSTFPSSTNVNGAAMATGMHPGHSGLVANLEYRVEVDAEAPFDTADMASVHKSDLQPDRPYLSATTIVEMMQHAGMRTAVAATKTVGALFDRKHDEASNLARQSALVSAGTPFPDAAAAAIRELLGPFPPKLTPNVPQDEWTTAALTEIFWKEGVPPFSLLWLGDPDFSQHDTAPGSPESLAGIKNADASLAKVIAVLEQKGVREETDILVVSDHGFSTVDRAVDIPALLNDAGFAAVKKLERNPKPGTVLVVGNGGTVLFYVTGGDEETIQRLVAWLQQSDFAGVIFARGNIEGAFSMADAHIEQRRGPDVVMAFRWTDRPNEFGVRGMINADWNRAAGKGTHATLSTFDIHNTLVAIGPDFRREFENQLPTGNVDLAPTILRILDVSSEGTLDGRVLSEAMIEPSGEFPKLETETLRASREFPTTHWQQYLKISKIGEHVYLDEGNSGD